MLEKHLAHLKKPGNIPAGLPPHPDMGVAGATHMPAPPVQPLTHPHSSATHSIKDDNSPAKSPATGTTASNWNSPNQIPGVSPSGSAMTDEYVPGAPPAGLHPQHPGAGMANAGHAYGMPGGMTAGLPTTPGIVPPGSMGYTVAPQGRPGQPVQHPMQGALAGGGQHRRQISDISGGAEEHGNAKRQQLYAPQPIQHIGPMGRR